jgi:prepilin-type N-terminal cleavage/methylation domain-containing protein/prepilin-type processing-associated H-X9-DG protein
MGHSNRGFTLIELLLVVAIILVIFMLMVPALTTVRRKALILACQSNMHQIDIWMTAYFVENKDVIPYLFYASEGMLDPEHMTDPGTDAQGLAAIVPESSRGILRCPADKGYGGVDYGITSSGVTCYSCFGQSYAYNNSPYTDPDSPYDIRSNPARLDHLDEKAASIIMLTDFSSVWHGSVRSDKESAKYWLNIMYFDGHVEGKEFSSDQAAKEFRNDESRRCWWPEP